MQGKEESQSVYLIRVSTQMGRNNYYAIDLKGSLSRNVQDSMLFCSETAAESYAGPIEHILEEHMGADLAPTTHVECVKSTSIIPRTVIESIPCP